VGTDVLARLILCITNPVAMDLTANSLLAIGDSPLMSSCEQEMAELVDACDALLVNIGCIDPAQRAAALVAVSKAGQQGKPWVLDPVGVGASSYRTQFVRDIIERSVPTVIKGNAGEIIAMAELFAKTSVCSGDVSKGLDSIAQCSQAVEAADALAESLGCIVIVTGPVDYITDGCNNAEQSLGDTMMTKVTAMGCTAGAVVAAFLAGGDDAFGASVQAMALMGAAGNMAARNAEIYAPGSFRQSFVDALYVLTHEN